MKDVWNGGMLLKLPFGTFFFGRSSREPGIITLEVCNGMLSVIVYFMISSFQGTNASCQISRLAHMEQEAHNSNL